MTQAQQYHHHDRAGIYIGSTPADTDPRHPELTMPPPYGATLVEPPERGAHQAAQLQADGSWLLVADWRGYEYWTADRVKHVIVDHSVLPPQDALSTDPGPTPEQVLATLTAVVQEHVDAPAQAWEYDNANSCVGYLDDEDPQIAAEAAVVKTFRSRCWVKSRAVRAEVLAGTRPVPTKLELIAELPAIPARPTI